MNLGLGLFYDEKGRNRRKWESLRRRMGGRSSKGLSGEQLHRAVMAIASTDSSLVKIESVGA